MQLTNAVTSDDSGSSSRWFNWLDGLIILGFVCFGVLVQVGILQAGNYPYIPLSGDGSNISSYSAGWDHPEAFQGDEILGDLNNILFYATIHIPITRFLEDFTGSYGAAFVLTLGIHSFLQLFGFYLLGRGLFKSRYWALLLSIITLMFVGMNLGEFWGFYPEPLPRFTFQAILPFIMAGAIAWRDKPYRWIWILAAVGGLIYVHPVSAPAWGLAIWLGLWVCRPAGWSFNRQVMYMGFLGVIFVLVCLPFVLNYLGAGQGGTRADYAIIRDIMAGTLAPGMMDISLALKDFIGNMAANVLPILGVVGAMVVLKLRKNERKSLYMVLLWVVGLVVGAVVIPVLDHALADRMGRIPFAVDLIRGLRYFIPLSLLFCLWALFELGQAATKVRVKQVFMGLGAVMVALWIGTHYQQVYLVRNGLSCLIQLELICSEPTPESTLMEAIKTDTVPGAGIMVSSGDREWLAIRYYALRPLVYTWRDGGGLFYANEIKLVEWLETRDRLDLVNQEPNLAKRLDQLIALTGDLNAQYLVTDFQIDWTLPPNQRADIVFSNEKGSLVALR